MEVQSLVSPIETAGHPYNSADRAACDIFKTTHIDTKSEVACGHQEDFIISQQYRTLIQDGGWLSPWIFHKTQ